MPSNLTVHEQFRVKLASALGARDWTRVETLFFQYGNHMELLGQRTGKKKHPTVHALVAVNYPGRPLLKVEV